MALTINLRSQKSLRPLEKSRFCAQRPFWILEMAPFSRFSRVDFIMSSHIYSTGTWIVNRLVLGFLVVAWFGSSPVPPPPLPSESSTSDTQEDWKWEINLLTRGGEAEEGPESYDGEEAWCFILINTFCCGVRPPPPPPQARIHIHGYYGWQLI
jgi:hypothetical protein